MYQNQIVAGISARRPLLGLLVHPPVPGHHGIHDLAAIQAPPGVEEVQQVLEPFVHHHSVAPGAPHRPARSGHSFPLLSFLRCLTGRGVSPQIIGRNRSLSVKMPWSEEKGFLNGEKKAGGTARGNGPSVGGEPDAGPHPPRKDPSPPRGPPPPFFWRGEKVARKHLILPISIEQKDLHLAMSDPLSFEAFEDVRFASGYPIQPAIAT